MEATINENENKTENVLYKFEEMADAMQKSIENIEKIVSQQVKLINVIENNNEDKSFDEFLVESKSQTEKLNEQLNVLKHRQETLLLVIKKCKEDEKCSEVLSLLSDALGMFSK